MIVALDFAPGLHGHFLEYVINRYFYKVVPNTDRIFHDSGAAHAFNTDKTYQSTKIVHCAHFSCAGLQYPMHTEKIIFIEHCADYDFVLLTNSFHRNHPDAVFADNFNAEAIRELHKRWMTNGSDLELRNNWFAKLNERHYDFELTAMRPQRQLPVFNFDFKTFFEFPYFCCELNRLAKFLNQRFLFDSSLTQIWNQFIQKNQGWKQYQLANQILCATLNKERLPIPNDWQLHAYLNLKLSRMFDLYDGILYHRDRYPEFTDELFDIVNDHLTTFDNKW